MKEIAIVAQTTVPTLGGSAGTAATTQAAQDPPFWASPMMPFVLLIILMYVFMFRSKKGQENKRQQMINQVKKGDEVQTIGGEFGRVVDTRDDRILVKVDETSNTKIWYARSAIHKVVGAGDKAETK